MNLKHRKHLKIRGCDIHESLFFIITVFQGYGPILSILLEKAVVAVKLQSESACREIHLVSTTPNSIPAFQNSMPVSVPSYHILIKKRNGAYQN